MNTSQGGSGPPMPLPGGKIPVQRFAVVDSTNKAARESIDSGLDGPCLFVADRQTGGYGRFGRAWYSPEGGLWLTLAWPVPAQHAGLIEGLGLRIGVAVVGGVGAALEKMGHSSARVQLKWPNDVLIGGRKAGGVLCEATGVRDSTWLIVGVGLNVNNEPESLPSDLRTPPTSLRAEGGQPINLEELLADLTERIVRAIDPAGAAAALMTEATARLYRLHETVRLTTPDGGSRTGKLVGLSEDGRLVLITDSGRFIAPHGAEFTAES